MKILVVEDDPDNRDVVELYLQAEGAEVRAAASAAASRAASSRVRSSFARSTASAPSA